MKKIKWFIQPILIVVILSAISLLFGVVGDTCEDNVIVAEIDTSPGKRIVTMEVVDVNGNYENNFLMVLPSGDVDNLEYGGVAVWPDDPNYLVILNAVPDLTDPNKPDLEGSFSISRVWGHATYNICFCIYDMAGNYDCKWVIVTGMDNRPPTVRSAR